MLKIIMHGCNGRMGQTIVNLIREDENKIIVAGVSADGQALNSFPVYKNILECKENADVIIDFSNTSTLNDLLSYATSHNTPLVIATTGFSDEELNKIKEASKTIPILRSANMSLGINLMLDLIKKATSTLEKDFDIEIIEKHHNNKVDAPSGTALLLADTINDTLNEKANYKYDRHIEKQKRTKNEIGIHAIRGGTIVGEHSVIFAGDDEVIEITHTASSRKIFAKGALHAVDFIVEQKTGLFSMQDSL